MAPTERRRLGRAATDRDPRAYLAELAVPVALLTRANEPLSLQPNATPNLSAHPLSIRVVGHTTLIYWWPVWLVGLVLAGFTCAGGTRLAVLPPDTAVKVLQPDTVYELSVGNRSSPSLESAAANTAKGQNPIPVRVARDKNYGIVDIAVILVAIFGSTVPLRGP